MRKPDRACQPDEIPLRLPDGRQLKLQSVLDRRARRLRLRLSEHGPRLTVPPGVAPAQIQHFLQRHLDWLATHWREDPDDHPLLPGHDTRLSLRGETLALRWQAAPWLHIRQEPGALIVARPAAASPAAITHSLHDYLLGQARSDIGRWLPHYLPGLPRAPRACRIRPLSSLWGSLSSQGTLSLDLALILAPSAAFEYVLVHELCHLIQPNHSPAFWQEVAQRCPDWRRQRSWLRQHGLGIKRQLHRLIRH